MDSCLPCLVCGQLTRLPHILTHPTPRNLLCPGTPLGRGWRGLSEAESCFWALPTPSIPLQQAFIGWGRTVLALSMQELSVHNARASLCNWETALEQGGLLLPVWQKGSLKQT